MSPTIILPRGAEQPKYHCMICGAGFYADEAKSFERHVGKCARTHEADVKLASPRTRLRALADPDEWDVEYERHVRQNPRAWYRERGIDPPRSIR